MMISWILAIHYADQTDWQHFAEVGFTSLMVALTILITKQ